MLGERGMWFKQCFWEWSAHVPMIASIPGFLQGNKSRVITSLVDLLPTIIDIGNTDRVPVQVENLAGKSLIPFFSDAGHSLDSFAISDYYHIGPCVPTRMVRKNNLKLIYTHGHPHLLFDLKNDPNELKNILIAENEIFNTPYSLEVVNHKNKKQLYTCLLYTSPSPRDLSTSRMPSSA